MRDDAREQDRRRVSRGEGEGDGCDDPAISRAVAHLVDQQNSDGSWNEDEFTGTGFPCVFYLKYHLYRNYFPLYALSRYRNQSLREQGLVAREFHAFEIGPERLKMGERAPETAQGRNREQPVEMQQAGR